MMFGLRNGVGVPACGDTNRHFHGLFRSRFVWRLPDGSLGLGIDFCDVTDDGRMQLITVWPGSDDSRCRIRASIDVTLPGSHH